MWNLVTLDGLFEGPKPWDLDWHQYVWGEELERLSIEQLRSADMLLFGRGTYLGMAKYWTSETGEVADYMNNLPKIVFSRTLTTADWNNTRIVKENAEAEVSDLKKARGKNAFIFGSANLCSTFMRSGLIDEYRLALVPLVLGRGNPLFKEAPETVRMTLLESRPLQSGCVILRYAPEKTSYRTE